MDKKISGLTAAGALTGTELVEIVQGGVNKQSTTQDIADLGGGAVDSVNGQTGVVVLDAGDIAFTPVGSIAATDVQTAIEELDTEKANLFVQTGTVYVDPSGSDTTGTLGRSDRPFQTIDAALVAGSAVTNLHVKLSMGIFAAPSSANLRSNLWLHGSGKPDFNWTLSQTTAGGGITITDPTALSGGTIIQGTLTFTDKVNIHVTDLGVDKGSDYVTAGGTEGDGIVFLSASSSVPIPVATGIEVRNVTILGRTATSLFHCLLIQSAYNAVVNNLDTYFASHGIALKTMNSLVDNVRGSKHNLDGVIIKTDASQFASRNVLTNFHMQSCGKGVYIETFAGSSAAPSQVIVSDGIIMSPTDIGFHVDGSGTAMSNNRISNVTVTSATNFGFDIIGSTRSILDGCMSVSAPTGFRVRPNAAGQTHMLTNCISTSGGTGFDVDILAFGGTNFMFLGNCYAFGATVRGFSFGGGIQSDGLGGSGNTTLGFGTSTQINLEARTAFGNPAGFSPTSKIHIAASATTASTGQIKLESGTFNTTPENGDISRAGDVLGYTTSNIRWILPRSVTVTGTLDFPSTAAGTSSDLTMSLTNAAVGDVVTLGVPHGSTVDNGCFTCWVSAANTVTVRFTNNDLTNAKDPASGTFRLVLLKY